MALETIPPALIGGIRYTVAGALLAAILLVHGERLPSPRHWCGLVLLGVLMIGVGNGFVIWAEQWVPSGIAAVIIAASPFWMAGLEALMPQGERLTARVLLGLGIGFGGIVLLVWPQVVGEGIQPNFISGVVALQLACIGWSLGSSYSKRNARSENALGASALQMLFGGIIMLGAATIRGEWSHLAFTQRSMIAEIYLVFVGSLLGYSAYVYALKHLPISTVSLYAYVNPLIAVLLGTLFLDEPFGPRIVVSSAMVLAGIAVVRWSSGSRKRTGVGETEEPRRSLFGLRLPGFVIRLSGR